MEQLTLSLEEPPVNPSVSQASEKEWMTHVATWPLSIAECLTTFDPSGSSGKTSQASCQVQEDRKSTRLNSSHSQQSRMPSSA